MKYPIFMCQRTGCGIKKPVDEMASINYCSDKCLIESLEMFYKLGLRDKIFHKDGTIEYTYIRERPLQIELEETP